MSALLYLLFCMKKNILFILSVTSYLYFCRCPFFIKYIVLCTVSCFIILYSTVQYICVKPLLPWENIFITTFNIEGKCHLILFYPVSHAFPGTELSWSCAASSGVESSLSYPGTGTGCTAHPSPVQQNLPSLGTIYQVQG